MELNKLLLEQLKLFGVGRRKLDDKLFIQDKPPARLGIYDLDDEDLCHEVVKSTCNIPGCIFTTESLLEFENHYNASHRYTCCQCKRVLPSPHLLDLHVQERHDSFFAVLATRKPSYCCYIEACKEKFMTADERLDHCVKYHKLPKDFRFEEKPKTRNKTKNKSVQQGNSMEVDNSCASDDKNKFYFNNSKQKAFAKYTGKRFTKNNAEKTSDVNMDDIVADLKESLPK